MARSATTTALHRPSVHDELRSARRAAGAADGSIRGRHERRRTERQPEHEHRHGAGAAAQCQGEPALAVAEQDRHQR